MRVILLQVALGVLALLAFGKAQTNENEVEVDEQQHDLVVPPCSCEEEAAMIESLLEDVGEKDLTISKMQVKFEQILDEKAKEFDATLVERDEDISALRAKLSEVNESDKNYVHDLEANLQSQKDKIIELEKETKSKELELEESLNAVKLKLEMSEDILKALCDVLMVDNDENLLEKAKEISLLASRMALIDDNNHSLDDDNQTEGNKEEGDEEVVDDDHEDLKDELHRVQQELADVRRQSLEEASHVQDKWKGFVLNVTELVDELTACRTTGEKEMGRIFSGDEEEMLDALRKLKEELNACHNSVQVEEQGTESKMDHEDDEVQNLQLDNLKSELESCRAECDAEIAELSKRLLREEEDKNQDENQVLAERQNDTLLHDALLRQAESLLYGLQDLEGELEGLQEGGGSSQNETRENAAQFFKHLLNALTIGRELAGLSGNLTDIQLVADVQDMMEESSYSNKDKDVHDAEPKEEEDIERESQERVVEMEVDSQGHAASPDESLISRIAELEEELVTYREKDELQNIHQEYLDTPPLFDEDILGGSTDPIEEEEELHQPETKSYTSSTPDYKGLSTFIGDVLTIGASLASTGMKNTCVGICKSCVKWVVVYGL